MNAENNILYSVVIPVFNGEFTIEEMVEKTVSFFELKQFLFEIILVLDSGTENSWKY